MKINSIIELKLRYQRFEELRRNHEISATFRIGQTILEGLETTAIKPHPDAVLIDKGRDLIDALIAHAVYVGFCEYWEKELLSWK